MKNKTVNIKPTMSVYNMFKNLTYKLWSALAEFIDNSISSFTSKKSNDEKYINIIFDDKNKSIIIEDNAYGIDTKDWERVLKIKEETANYIDKKSKNEFGRGLKTAAFWFGKKLTVISKTENQKEEKVVIDIEDKSNDGEYEIEKSNKNKIKNHHGTIIQIDKIYENKIFGWTDLKKLPQYLNETYRHDIRKNNIKIRILRIRKNDFLEDLIKRFNNENDKNIKDKNKARAIKGEMQYLKPKNPEIFSDEDGNREKYIFRFKDSITYRDKKYNFNGNMYIRKTGSRSKAGINLMRRNRIVELKVKKFLPDAGSFEYQRINGEINMDDFDVVQSKDKIDITNELFEKLKDKLFEIGLKDFVKKARNIKMRSTKTDNKKITSNFQKTIRKIKNSSFSSIDEKQEQEKISLKFNKNFDTDKKINNSFVKYNGQKGIFKIMLELNSNVKERSNQMEINEAKNNKNEIERILQVKIYNNHPFFNTIRFGNSSSAEVKTAQNNEMKFLAYWAIAETIAIEKIMSINEFRVLLSQIIAEESNEIK